MNDNYQPSPQVLENYANILVNFALGGGKGIREGDLVLTGLSEYARPFLDYIQNAVIKAGGNPICRLHPEGVVEWINYATDTQLQYFPQYSLQLYQEIDHRIYIDAATLPVDVDPKKRALMSQGNKPIRDLYDKRVLEGNLTWTMALYGNQIGADRAGMSLKEYWEQIIQACFLDCDDPIAEWRKKFAQINVAKDYLSNLPISSIHIEGKDVDLTVGIGEDRKWLAGDGCNMPSFEIFTTNNCHMTEGYITFSEPLYYNGKRIENISLEFNEGEVVKATSSTHQDELDGMLLIQGMRRVGEFSMTDRRFSRISRPMGHVLYDENIGGPYGNMHLALGDAYLEPYKYDSTGFTEEDWKAKGFNHALGHRDIVSTTDKRAVATLVGGGTEVVFENGQYPFI